MTGRFGQLGSGQVVSGICCVSLLVLVSEQAGGISRASLSVNPQTRDLKTST